MKWVSLLLLAFCTNSFAQSPIKAGITAPVAADFNEDGYLDLAVHGTTDISVYMGKGNGLFSAPVVTPLDRSETRVLFHAAVAGDFNADGNQDLIAYGYFYRGTGDGRLELVSTAVIHDHLQTLRWDSDAIDDVVGYRALGDYAASLGGQLERAAAWVAKPAYAMPWYLYDTDTPYDFAASGALPFSLGSIAGTGAPVDVFVLGDRQGLNVILAATGGLKVFRPIGGFGLYTVSRFAERESLPVPADAVLKDAVRSTWNGSWGVSVAYVQGSTAVLGQYPYSYANPSGIGQFGAMQIVATFPVTDSNVTLTFGDWNGDGIAEIATQDGDSVRFVALPAAVSSASGIGKVAAGSLASVYGLQLSTSSPGSVRVSVQQQGGVAVSGTVLFASPEQVNFVVPSGIPAGRSTVTIDDGSQQTVVQALVEPVAPGLFAYENGRAIGYASRMEAAGVSTILPTSSAIPIDGRPLHLVLYGTGIRGRSALASVQARVGGIVIPADYVGPDGNGVPGLDQVNLRLPAALAGRGVIDVKLTVDGVDSNTATIEVR